MPDATPSRRRLLATAAGTLLGVTAGCVDSGSDGDATDSTATGPETASTDATASGEPAVTAADTQTPTHRSTLDLREANVVGVAVEPDGDTYDFDVTLQHDDDGEDGYANWWQVERVGGARLGRRELLHAHSQQPFTRSATVEIPGPVECVVVRGHDQTHGYGGRAAAVDLDSGTSRRIDQGPEPRSIEPDECPTE